jgi:sensor histidine kinase YesM
LSSLDVNAVIDTAFGVIVLVLLLLANKYMYKDALLKFTAVVPKYVFILILLYLIFTPIIMQSLVFPQDTTSTLPLEVKDRLSFIRLMFGIFSIIVVVEIFTVLFQTVANRRYEKATELLKMQMENQIKHYSEVNQIQHEMRAFRHDMKSQMLCIRTMIGKNQTGQAIEYLDKTWGMVEKNTQCFDTGNSIIDALIADKQQHAEQYNTKILFTGFLPVEGVDLLDLCIIIGNALDNAIEACEKDLSQSDKEIIFDSRVLQGYLVMRFQNPVFVKVDILNDTILTTKTDKTNHGFGLYNIKKIVRKYDGDFKVCLQENNFCLETTLHCESKEEKRL